MPRAKAMKTCMGAKPEMAKGESENPMWASAKKTAVISPVSEMEKPGRRTSLLKCGDKTP
jgi:hypothetical protein